MNLNDLVCCFCLATLRKIEKFTETAKEVDSILKQSIKTKDDGNEVHKYYNLVVSTLRNISIDCSRALYKTDACNIRDELLRQVERDLVKIEETEDDPLQLSEDTLIDNKSDSTNDVPWITVSLIKEEQNESIDENEAVLPEQLKRTFSKEEIKAELPREEVIEQNITRKRRNKSDKNIVQSNEIKEKIANEISKQNCVDALCLSDKPFSCHTCTYTAKYKSKLTRHLRTHTGEKPFCCDICLYKFSRKSHLRYHLRKHTGERPLSCNLCSYKCNTKSHLTRHLRSHTGEKPFSCNSCSFTCSHKIHLRDHLRTHTGEKPFSCYICSYKCIRKSHLTRHLRKHTGEKPFSCNICSYKSGCKSTLRNHLRIHTGEKPFSCNICSYKCSRNSYLTKHLRTHAGEKTLLL